MTHVEQQSNGFPNSRKNVNLASRCLPSPIIHPFINQSTICLSSNMSGLVFVPPTGQNGWCQLFGGKLSYDQLHPPVHTHTHTTHTLSPPCGFVRASPPTVASDGTNGGMKEPLNWASSPAQRDGDIQELNLTWVFYVSRLTAGPFHITRTTVHTHPFRSRFHCFARARSGLRQMVMWQREARLRVW